PPPADPGRDTDAILAAATAGALQALLIGGVDVDDLPDPEAALAAVDAAPFVVSLELRHSPITDRADVVFPVAPVAEKAGTFVNWEGRQRSFDAALPPAATADMRVLAALADEVGVDLGLSDTATVRADVDRLGSWAGTRPPAPQVPRPDPVAPGPGEAVLTGWRMLLDGGRMQTGEPHLAGTARPAVARISAATAAEIGCADGAPVQVSTERGALSLPVELTEMPDRVVWVPLNTAGAAVYRTLEAPLGSLVRIEAI
uniref:molybdopterin-dependent oxidoreductase n=1 Tax=Mycolicibacterium bacteremicum TaxID=564198 RepID=UPI0026E93E68